MHIHTGMGNIMNTATKFYLSICRLKRNRYQRQTDQEKDRGHRAIRLSSFREKIAIHVQRVRSLLRERGKRSITRMIISVFLHMV